jgi:hypothetical protein
LAAEISGSVAVEAAVPLIESSSVVLFNTEVLFMVALSSMVLLS